MYNKISLLIPVYGVEKYIERCARSLFGQTYQNIEYIFVDDCTKDSSIAVLKRFWMIIHLERSRLLLFIIILIKVYLLLEIQLLIMLPVII